MDNNKLINQFIANLDKKGLDSSLLESDLFNFNQKFVLYNAISSGANLDVLANPDIDAYEMEDILDEQRAMMKEMRNNHGINPEYYNMSQLLELNDALAHDLDISQYKNHEYTANHMYIAKTFQIEKLDGMEKITSDMPISELIELRDDAREFKAFISLKNNEQNIGQQSQSMQNNTNIEFAPSRGNNLSFINGNNLYSQFKQTINKSTNPNNISQSEILFDNKGGNGNTIPDFRNNEEVLTFFNEINPKLVEQVLNKNEICFSMKGMILYGEHAQENPKLLFELFASNCGFKATNIQSNNVISSQKQLQCQQM